VSTQVVEMQYISMKTQVRVKHQNSTISFGHYLRVFFKKKVTLIEKPSLKYDIFYKFGKQYNATKHNFDNKKLYLSRNFFFHENILSNTTCFIFK